MFLDVVIPSNGHKGAILSRVCMQLFQSRDLFPELHRPQANTLWSQVTDHNNTSVSSRGPYLKFFFFFFFFVFEIRPAIKKVDFLALP